MEKSVRLFAVLFGIILLIGSVYAGDYLALQGNVLESGADLSSGDVRVAIYDAPTGGNLVYDSLTDFDGVISDGKYDILVGNGSQELNLDYGQKYYIELYIDGGAGEEKFSFDGKDRQPFQSSVGNVSLNFIHGSDKIVLTNESVTFDSDVNVTVSDGGWFKGLFNWTTLTNWLDFDGATLSFNETRLNDTIDLKVDEINTTENIQNLGFYNTTEIDNNLSLYYNKTEVDSNLSNYILTASESDLNVNSSSWWAGLSGWVSGWFDSSSDELSFNETKLNETIGLKIDEINTTDNIMNLEFYNESEVDSIASGLRTDIEGNYSDAVDYTNTNVEGNVTTINSNIALNYSALQDYTNTNVDGNLTEAKSYTNTVISGNESDWLSTYNSSYDGLINNDSYLSTYNESYDLKNSSRWVLSDGNISYNSGNVGIGDTTPSEKLEITGNLKLSNGGTRYIYGPSESSVLGIDAGSIGLFSDHFLEFEGTPIALTTAIGLYTKDSNNNSVGRLSLSGGSDQSDLLLNKTNLNLGENNITNVGRLGIGTELPSNYLDVRGDGNFSGNLYVDNDTLVNTWLYNQTEPANVYTNTNVNGNVTTINSDIALNYSTLITALGGNISNVNSDIDANYSDVKSYVNTNIDGNVTNLEDFINTNIDGNVSLKADLAGGNAFTGTQTFDGDFGDGGVRIASGDVFAQQLYVYNITALNVDHLSINGSTLPQVGFDDSFDIGNASLRWRDLYVSQNGYFNGSVYGDSLYAGGVLVDDWLYNQTIPANSYTDSVIGTVNTTGNIQNLLNSTGVYSTYNETYDLKNGSRWDTDGTDIWRSSGSVGIGTSTPANALNVVGDTNISGTYYSDEEEVLTWGSYAGGTGQGGGSIGGVTPVLTLHRDRPTLGAGYKLGGIEFRGTEDPATSTDNAEGAGIEAWGDGAWTATSSPGLLNFTTTPSGSLNPVGRMVIREDGKVGIGTADPIADLHVIGDLRLGYPTSTSSANISIQGGGAGEVAIARTGSGLNDADLVFYTTYSTLQERMRITGNGLVGIGTSDPTDKLNVVGDGNITGDLWVEGGDLLVDGTTADFKFDGEGESTLSILSGGTGSPTIYLDRGSSNRYHLLNLTTGGVQNWIATTTAADTTPDLFFKDGSDNDVLTLQNGGNVGIGTDSPDSMLDVRNSSGDSFVNIDSQTGSAGIFLQEQDSANYGFRLYYDSDDFRIDRHDNDATGANVLFIERTNGNVGIGSTAPAYNLEVANSATALNVSGNLYANSTNVGIGTSNPTNRFTVKSAGTSDNSIVVQQSSSTNNLVELGQGSADQGFVKVYNSSGDLTSLINSGGDSYFIGGDVGIGTSTLTAPLTLGVQSSSGQADAITIGHDSVSAYRHTIVSGLSSGSNASNFLAFNISRATATGSNEVIRFTGEGNVGIGTVDPNLPLEIDYSDTISYTGSGDIGSALSIVDAQGLRVFNSHDSASYSGLTLRTRTTGGSVWRIDNVHQDSYIGDLVFQARTGASTSAETVRFKSSGEVGIGTNSPAYKLEVANSATALNVSGMLYANSSGVGVGTSSPRGVLEVNVGDVADTNVSNSDNYPLKVASDEWLTSQVTGIEFWNGVQKDVPTARIVSQMAGNGAVGENLLFQTQPSNDTNPNPLQPTTKLAILADGNVGIGTTGPGEKLDVNGTIQLTDDDADNIVQIKTEGDKRFDFITDRTSSTDAAFAFFGDDGSSELMRITESGDVGINTSSPEHVLDVDGIPNFRLSSMNLTLQDSWVDTLNFETLSSGTGGAGIKHTGTGSFSLSTPGRFRLDTNGEETFDIYANDSHMLWNVAYAADKMKGVMFFTNITPVEIFRIEGDGEVNVIGNLGVQTFDPTYALEVNNDTAALNVSGFLYANSTNVGIGTSSPTHALDVLSSDFSVGKFTRSGSNGAGFELANTGGNSVTFGLLAQSGNGFLVSDGSDYFFKADNDEFALRSGLKLEWDDGTGGALTNPDTNLYRSAANYLTTDDNFTVGGNLGIATTTPNSNLHVNGTLNVTTQSDNTEAFSVDSSGNVRFGI